MTDIFDYLRARPYPGRGILLGAAPDGAPVCAYFIMGRSENSRNRVFERTPDGIRTRAFDEAKMTDPSLIIYHPARRTERGLIVTNGDQKTPSATATASSPRRGRAASSRTRRTGRRASPASWPRTGATSSPSCARRTRRARAARAASTSTSPRRASGTSSAPTRASARPCRAFTASRWRSRSRPSRRRSWRRRSGRRWMRITASRSTSRRRARK